MIYAISDIHGCYDKYAAMLDKIGISDGDTLYVLGDTADRGRDGIKVLLDMMERKNVVPVAGNHESMAADVLGPIVSNPGGDMDGEAYLLWMYNGGGPTLSAFFDLDEVQRRSVVSYLGSFILRTTVSAGGRKFHLSHTLPPYVPGRKIEDAPHRDFLWGKADYGKVYADGTLFVTGHTPTVAIDPAYKGKIYSKNGHICIDCGAVFGGRLGCVCLDTLEEFYI